MAFCHRINVVRFLRRDSSLGSVPARLFCASPSTSRLAHSVSSTGMGPERSLRPARMTRRRWSARMEVGILPMRLLL
uniref:Uncharacterized protein n=1 Tax=Arundo donax TaxID=35708 RepID=A0A0A9CNQ7_ARUDO